MTLDESVHGMRLRVIERAQALGTVSAVCRELGISRTLFYRWRKRLERYGIDGVHPRRQRGTGLSPLSKRSPSAYRRPGVRGSRSTAQHRPHIGAHPRRGRTHL
jgi:transposase-like protein